MDLETASGATISACGRYRYALWRTWDDASPGCVFIMLNPSTADATQDDPTIRRCIGFAKREGCGSLVVVNLFAFRATSPVAMKASADPVGPENDAYIHAVVSAAGGPIIGAWGAHGSFRNRDRSVERIIDRTSEKPMSCLGKTKAGHPRHPLYVRGDAALLPMGLPPRAALKGGGDG